MVLSIFSLRNWNDGLRLLDPTAQQELTIDPPEAERFVVSLSEA